MESKDKVTLTREWIMLMLFESPKSMDDLIAHGCKVMVFGHEYDGFLEIVQRLNADGYILKAGAEYQLGQKAIFHIKKHVIIPLESIIEDPMHLNHFITKHKMECDTNFLRKYGDEATEGKRVVYLKAYAEQHYDKVAIIILLILNYLK